MKNYDLIKAVSVATDAPAFWVKKVVRKFLDVLRFEMQRGGSVTLYGVGTFRVKRRGPARAVSVQTGRPYSRPPSYKISFKPSPAFKRAAIVAERGSARP